MHSDSAMFVLLRNMLSEALSNSRGAPGEQKVVLRAELGAPGVDPGLQLAVDVVRQHQLRPLPVAAPRLVVRRAMLDQPPALARV